MQKVGRKGNNNKDIQEMIDPSADSEGQGLVNHPLEQLHLAYGGDALQECHIISAPFHLRC